MYNFFIEPETESDGSSSCSASNENPGDQVTIESDDEEEVIDEEEFESTYTGRTTNELHSFLCDLADELHLNEPLYINSDVDLLWVLIELASLFKDKSISKASLSRVIKIIKRILPKPNIFPPTKHKFYNIIDKLCPDGEPPIVSYTCNICSQLFESFKIKKCPNPNCEINKPPVAVTVVNDIESEFRHMFE